MKLNWLVDHHFPTRGIFAKPSAPGLSSLVLSSLQQSFGFSKYILKEQFVIKVVATMGQYSLHFQEHTFNFRISLRGVEKALVYLSACKEITENNQGSPGNISRTTETLTMICSDSALATGLPQRFFHFFKQTNSLNSIITCAVNVSLTFTLL